MSVYQGAHRNDSIIVTTLRDLYRLKTVKSIGKVFDITSKKMYYIFRLS